MVSFRRLFQEPEGSGSLRKGKKQIPFWNDIEKGSGKSRSFAALRMTNGMVWTFVIPTHSAKNAEWMGHPASPDKASSVGTSRKQSTAIFLNRSPITLLLWWYRE